MANPVNGVSSLQQATQVAAQNQAQAAKPAPKAATAAPKDTVNISAAGKAANQAQTAAKPQQASGDADHDGDSK